MDQNRIALTSRSSFRIVAALLLTVAGIVFINLYFAAQLKSSMIELRKQELVRLVTLGMNSIEPTLQEFREGNITKEDALISVRNTIRKLVYDDPSTRNYLFMSTYDGTMLVQPFEPELEGSDQWDLQDSRGIYIIRELVEEARRGRGFVEYHYPPPKSTEPQMKISYVVGIPELDAYLGTGLYLGDIQLILSRIFRSAGQILIILFAVLILFLVLFFRPYYSVYNFLLHRFSEISGDPDRISTSIDIRTREHSEVWLLTKHFRFMLEQIVRTRETLEKELAQKEILLKEIHHRVKNNLQIVSSLLNLQASSLNDEEQRRVLTDSSVRIRSMSLIHESLYSSGVYHEIEMGYYLRELVTGIFQTYRPEHTLIELDFRIEDIQLSMDRAILCGLIVTELVTNALKYAFVLSEKGTLEIGMVKTDNEYTLRVADNGCGIDTEIFHNKTDSLGITLVRSLTSQLAGSLNVESGNGTILTLSFPGESDTP